MKEEFLHFIWRLGRYDQHQLYTTNGLPIQILDRGRLNTHSGPDFLNARMQLDGLEWGGPVEMHMRSSDWYKHGHHDDPAYANVILHVVLEDDEPVLGLDNKPLPTLELKDRIPPGLQQAYRRLLYSEHWIPCAPLLDQLPGTVQSLWLERLLIERLEAKVHRLRKRLDNEKGNWEETFYQAIAMALGGTQNALPMEILTRATPLALLRKHRDKLLEIEALLFGQAGMLEGPFKDDYPNKLQKEFAFLAKKYQLRKPPGMIWKFMRMRPAGFPTIRLAQLSQLIHQSQHLFSKAIALTDLKEAEAMFRLRVSRYWSTHYRFDHFSEGKAKGLGKSAIHNLLINSIAPILFLYGKTQGREEHCARALQLLAQIPAERNHITRGWEELGLGAKHTGHSQALIQLKKQYCDRRRCLRCQFGAHLLR